MRFTAIPVKDTRLLAVVAMLLALASTAFVAPDVAGEDMSSQSQDISKLFEKAAKEGQVRLIVGLQLPAPFIPEGAHASAKGVERQREAIMNARELFYENMSSRVAGEYEVYAQWDSVPQVALKATAAALEHLVNSPLVMTIQEDKERRPSKTGAAFEAGEDTVGNTKSGGTD
jgi:hypothetical protein